MSEPLAAEFEPVSPEQWAAPIQEKRGNDAPLETKLEEDVATKWLYTPEDALGADPGGLPGQAPFVRGMRVGTSWQVRQECALADVNAAREQITAELMDDATEVLLRVAADGSGGVQIDSLEDLEYALHGIDVAAAPLALRGGTRGLEIAALACELWRERKVDASTIKGSLGIDPVGALARVGADLAQLDDAVTQALQFAAQTYEQFPAVRSLAVDTAPYVDAGAGPVLELAVAVATAIVYLRAGETAGLTPEQVAASLEWRVSVGVDQFVEIAKLRALRRLWTTVLEHSGVAEEHRYSPTYATTSRRMVSSLDPWVNVLRETTATFAAAVGGADGITVVPFDEAAGEGFGEPGEIGVRLARMTQMVLGEESYLGRVADPGAGSWYIESLTDELARDAWAKVQEIEADGSVLALLASGKLAELVAAEAEDRRQLIAKRKLTKTGVNAFPMLGEDGVQRAAETALGPWAPATNTKPGALIPHRDARDFEQLRARGRALVAAGHEPRMLLACTGSLASHVAISQWAKNFFEAAGVTTIESGAQPDDAHQVALLAQHGVEIVAVCPGRGTEPEQSQSLVAALRDGGAKLIYLLGVDEDQAIAAGADHGAREGVDMVAVLGELLTAFEAAATTGKEA